MAHLYFVSNPNSRRDAAVYPGNGCYEIVKRRPGADGEETEWVDADAFDTDAEALAEAVRIADAWVNG
jgi:hypothetical protein